MQPAVESTPLPQDPSQLLTREHGITAARAPANMCSAAVSIDGANGNARARRSAVAVSKTTLGENDQISQRLPSVAVPGSHDEQFHTNFKQRSAEGQPFRIVESLRRQQPRQRPTGPWGIAARPCAGTAHHPVPVLRCTQGSIVAMLQPAMASYVLNTRTPHPKMMMATSENFSQSDSFRFPPMSFKWNQQG